MVAKICGEFLREKTFCFHLAHGSTPQLTNFKNSAHIKLIACKISLCWRRIRRQILGENPNCPPARPGGHIKILLIQILKSKWQILFFLIIILYQILRHGYCVSAMLHLTTDNKSQDLQDISKTCSFFCHLQQSSLQSRLAAFNLDPGRISSANSN